VKATSTIADNLGEAVGNLGMHLQVLWLPTPVISLTRGVASRRDPLSDEPSRAEVFFTRPDGTRITLAHLPPGGLKPSSRDEKSIVVAAVLHGLITLGDACKRYCLSTEEYLAWHDCLAASTIVEQLRCA
jgi:hypothetical protein